MYRRLVLLALLSLMVGCESPMVEDEPLPKTWTDVRFGRLVRQKHDTTCGLASLATIVTYHWGDPVTEAYLMDLLKEIVFNEEKWPEHRAEILKGAAEEEKWEDIKEDGASMRELHVLADAFTDSPGRDYVAYATPYKFDDLVELSEYNQPGVVHLKVNGMEHFAVFRGIYNGYVYLADPERGQLRLKVRDFLDEWSAPEVIVLVRPGQDHRASRLTTIYGFERTRPQDDLKRRMALRIR